MTENIEIRLTHRGFAIGEFADMNGVSCSIQKSSLASEEALWLGVNDPEPKIMASQTPEGGNGWVPYPLPDGVSCTTRMHLTKEQAAALIPLLQYFVMAGNLPIITPREKDWRLTSDVPRRQCLDLSHPAELSIRDSARLVESMGANPALTDAINMLHAAREKIADYIDKEGDERNE